MISKQAIKKNRATDIPVVVEVADEVDDGSAAGAELAVEGTGDLSHAQTMAFTTLMLFQLFNTVNARSDKRSAFAHLFANRWLWSAIVLSLALQALVLYVPGLQRAFGTVALGTGDWLRCLTVASVVRWVREANKLVTRAMARNVPEVP